MESLGAWASHSASRSAKYTLAIARMLPRELQQSNPAKDTQHIED